MRPKKRILIIDKDDIRRGVLAYGLRVHGYCVQQATKIIQAEGYATDLILGYWPLPEKQFVELWRKSDVPCVIVLRPTESCPAELPRIVSPTMEDLLNQIIILTRRKRGPKKGFVRKKLIAA